MDFYGSPAHPNSERDFDVLATPNGHVAVVGPQMVEELLADAEEAASHGWSGDRVVLALSQGLESFRQLKPFELQEPIKPSDNIQGIFERHVGKAALIDGVNHRAGHGRVIAADAAQQGLQPAVRAFAVTVQESEDGGPRNSRCRQSSCDESLAVWETQKADFWHFQQELGQGQQQRF